MLAGLPKAPSAFNPVVNPKRARLRQQYVLRRMLELGFINPKQHDAALKQALVVKRDTYEYPVHAEFVAEMARQLAAERFPEDVYSRGLRVYTTILKSDQEAAYHSLRLKGWLRRFNGVASFYLHHYLGWFRALDRFRTPGLTAPALLTLAAGI